MQIVCRLASIVADIGRIAAIMRKDFPIYKEGRPPRGESVRVDTVIKRSDFSGKILKRLDFYIEYPYIQSGFY